MAGVCGCGVEATASGKTSEKHRRLRKLRSVLQRRTFSS